MDILFNAEAAGQLLIQMDKYCAGIQKETQDLLVILKDHGKWNDDQTRAFQANMMEMAKDLDKMLAIEGDYMRTYYERIQELRR